jgi:hypothetical protein
VLEADGAASNGCCGEHAGYGDADAGHGSRQSGSSAALCH